MTTPSSINSIFNRIRNFRVHLDASSDSQIDADTMNRSQQSDIQIKLSDIYPSSPNMNMNDISSEMHDDTHQIPFPETPKLSSPSTISSSNVRSYRASTQSTKRKKSKRQNTIPKSSSSNMSISSASEFQNVFQKLQSFRVSLDSPLLRTHSHRSNRAEIESLNVSMPSLLQPQAPDSEDSDDTKSNLHSSKLKTNVANLSFESQIIANIEPVAKQGNNLCSTRKSQKIDLKQFQSLPSPPKPAHKRHEIYAKTHTKQQILPFHDLYKSQMKEILGEKEASLDSVYSNRSAYPHYYYTSPSVASDAATIPGHLLLQFPENETSETLQNAYKKHRQSIDLKRHKNRKKVTKTHFKKKKNPKKTHCESCSCHHHHTRHKRVRLMTNGRASYDGDIEEDEKKERTPVIQSTIGMNKRYKKKKVLMSPPIAITIKRSAINCGVSDVDSEQILNENTETAGISLRGGIVENLVRMSSISPSAIWYNNRKKLHIKEIRNYSREHTIISSVCCALWSKYELEILKLFKLSWAQRIMAFGEASVMFYVVDMNENNKQNTAKQLFHIAENRFNKLEYIEVKYRLDSDKHKFALLCIVDSYYIINETDQYFIDQSHCIPSYLIRNKRSVHS